MKASTPKRLAVLVLLATFCFVILASGAGVQPLGWKEFFSSENAADRARALDLAQDHRQSTVDFLIGVLDEPVSDAEDPLNPLTPRNMAIRLLGEYRAKGAIPGLMRALEFQVGPHFSASFDAETASLRPAGRALVEIGLPCVEPALAVIRREGCSSADMRRKVLEGRRVQFQPKRLERFNPFADECLNVIVRILGPEHTRLLLENTMKNETSREKKANVRSALELLASPKFAAVARKGTLLSQP